MKWAANMSNSLMSKSNEVFNCAPRPFNIVRENTVKRQVCHASIYDDDRQTFLREFRYPVDVLAGGNDDQPSSRLAFHHVEVCQFLVRVGRRIAHEDAVATPEEKRFYRRHY